MVMIKIIDTDLRAIGQNRKYGSSLKYCVAWKLTASMHGNYIGRKVRRQIPMVKANT